MGQTLTNGIYLPAEGERNCYEGLAANWTALDGMIGGYNVHISNTTIHVTAEDKAAWNGKADASALTAHTGNTTIHVTAADKEAWNGKADASALTAHTGDTTIHVTSADKQAWDGHIADTTMHVTSTEKAIWNTVSDKANDTDVVHKNGAETIAGPKTFSDNTNFTSDSLFTSSGALDVLGGRIASIYRDKDKKEVARLTAGVQSSGRSLLEFMVRDIFSNVYQTCGFGLRFQSSSVYGLIPITGDTHIIGASNVKLKSVYTNQINGINPGALFLPQDRSSRVDISAYFTATASGDINSMTAPDDGFIFLLLTDVLMAHCLSQTANTLLNYGQTFARHNAGILYILFPIRKNDIFSCQWYTTATAVTVNNAFFIPCKGNI